MHFSFRGGQGGVRVATDLFSMDSSADLMEGVGDMSFPSEVLLAFVVDLN